MRSDKGSPPTSFSRLRSWIGLTTVLITGVARLLQLFLQSRCFARREQTVAVPAGRSVLQYDDQNFGTTHRGLATHDPAEAVPRFRQRWEVSRDLCPRHGELDRAL